MSTITTTPVIGPDSVELHAEHLVITGRYEGGSSHNVHLVANNDLGVILNRGQRDGAIHERVPHNIEDTGLVIVSLGVDDDHDQIHYRSRSSIDADELLAQAIESLVMARNALKRLRQA